MFKVEPGKVAPSGPADSKAAIERATQAFMNAGAKPNAQETPVSNPTSVSPEEMSAISKTSESETPQNDSNEAAAPQEPEATKAAKPEEPLSSQYAQLARKEKAIRQKAMEIKAKEQELAAREAALKPQSEPKAQEPSLKDLAQKDPLRALQELGLSYEQITEVLLNQNPQEQALRGELKSEVDTLKAEIKALREESQKTRQQDQEQAYKNAVAQIKTDVTSMVKASDDYEMIRETGSVDDVVELIEATFKEEGRVMPIDEAAQLVEEHLLEEATKLTNLKKIKARLASVKTETAPATKQVPVTQQQASQPKTLTNSMSTNRPLSAKERAILAFEGKLTKTGS